jgi:fructokinase
MELSALIGGEPILVAVILCLGEAIVDLVCERRIASVEDVSSLVPQPGGALANVAVAASRAGAEAALAGGAGDDEWGHWLCARLEAAGVELSWFDLVEGARTPIAFVFFDVDGEPRFQVYGEGIEAGMRSVAGRLEEAIGAASALVFGSNTLVGEPERALTLEARHLAMGRDVPVLFDPNIRPNRWDDLELARELCDGICGGSFVVRANRAEARMITGIEDPAAAAERLCENGARIAVVTRGAGGAVMRGEAEADHAGIDVEVVSPLGAGDAFMGTLAAGLERAGWDAGRAAEALPAAVEAGAAACRDWGAQT